MQDGIQKKLKANLYKEKSSSKEQTFSTEDILNLDYEKWEFVDVKHTIIKEGKSASISDFMILDPFRQTVLLKFYKKTNIKYG